MPGRPSAFGRASRVHDPDVAVPSDLRKVRVAVSDDVAAGEPCDEPVVATLRGAWIVDQPDPQALRLDDRALGQRRLEVGLVHVPVDGLEVNDSPKLLQDGGRGHVPEVQGDGRLLQDAHAVGRQRSAAARKVRIAEERDQKRPSTKRPSR